MRLFHVSEESDIPFFVPRKPNRTDLEPTVGLVWAIDEARLPNFLTPRDCPRVTYHVGSQTTEADKKRFFTATGTTHAVVIENSWFRIMQNTTLYIYEFSTAQFVLQDAVAGYYVSENTQYPIQKICISDLFAELISRNVEIRIVESLWDIADAVQKSTLNWSLCRMKNAKPRKNGEK